MSQALKSRTVLFGLLLTVASMIQVFIPYLSPEYVGPVGAVVGAAVTENFSASSAR